MCRYLCVYVSALFIAFCYCYLFVFMDRLVGMTVVSRRNELLPGRLQLHPALAVVQVGTVVPTVGQLFWGE